MKSRFVFMPVFLMILLSANLVLAQANARIWGTVSDSNGAVVPGAQVAVIHEATRLSRTTETNGQGQFVVTQLQPGDYRLEVQAAGFKKFTRAGLTLRVDDSVEVKTVLELGPVVEVVEVRDVPPVLQSTTSAVGEVIDNKMVTELPLNSRQPLQLALMTPGVNPGRQMESTSQPFNRASNFSVGGGRGNVNEILLDGASNTMPEGNPGFSAVTVFPSVESIQEFKVQTNAYSAEYGNSGGGLVNIVSKSGTNQLHGSLFEFLRNSRFDANNFFNNRGGIPLASFKRNQFGVAAGGPVILPKLYDGRNRTFFFTTWESTLERNGVTYNLSIPTALEKAGDFSQNRTAAGAQVNIYDPMSTTYDPVSRIYTRTAFAGNVIPQSRISPIMAKALQQFPEPNRTGVLYTNAQNFLRSVSHQMNDHKFDVRLDQQLRDRHRIYGRYSWNQRRTNRPAAFGTLADPNYGQLPTDPQGAKLGYTYVINSHYLLDAKFGYNYLYFGQVSGSAGYDLTQLGFPQYYASALQAPSFPRINFTDYSSLGWVNGTMEGWQASQVYQVSLARSSGNRVTRVGFEARRGRVKRLSVSYGGGTFSFDRSFTQGPNAQQVATNAGNAIASAVLGVPSSGSVTLGTVRTTHGWTDSFYVQDDWRVSSRLTLNLGLRYDLQLPQTSADNNLNWFDPSAASPLSSQVTGLQNLRGTVVFATDQQTHPWETNYRDFAPRIGFAYRAGERSAIRGGYGIFIAPHPYTTSALTGAGYSASTSYVASVDGFTPTGMLSNPYPNGILKPIGMGTSPSELINIGQSITFLAVKSPTPYVQQWNLALQRQVTSTLSLEGAYVGSKGTHLPDANYPLNQLRPEVLGPQLITLVNNPFYGVISVGTLASRQVQQRYLMTAFPQYTSVSMWSSTAASSIYHSLQVKANQRFGKGLNFLLAYTFSKQIDDCSGLYDWLEPASTHQNYYNRRADRAVSDQDITHRLAVTFTYSLPFGRGQAVGHNWSPILNRVLGGWQANGILAVQSGIPLSVTTTNNSYAFNSIQRPNSTGQSAALSGAPQERLSQYFRTDVFTNTALYTFGNLGRNLPDVRGPGLSSFDFAIFKNIALKERARLQIRGEAFNLTNTPEFDNPNTSLMSSSFGQITAQRNKPRQVQIALKLLF